MKRYLLDTHLIYWWMTADARLGKATQRIIAQAQDERLTLLTRDAAILELGLDGVVKG